MLPLAESLHSSFANSHFVLVDLWGHGLSDTPVLPHEPSLFHDMIDSLLDKLAWKSTHLVGYSFGGALAVGYTLSRKPRVQSITLVAPAGLIPYSILSTAEKDRLNDDDELEAQKWVLKWLEGGELVVPLNWKERVVKGEVVAEAVKEWQIRNHPGHMASVLAVVRDGGVFDRDVEFSEVAHGHIPSYAVMAEQDGFSRARDLERTGFKQVSVVQEAGHDVVRKRVPEVASFIKGFWSEMGDNIH